jgi:large subunit ribosomal protein L19
MNPIIKEITAHQVKSDIAPFKVGDGVRVHTKVREGDKERVQVYSGIVIARKGSGIHESFTVRRLSYGEGVERVFPVNSPNIEKIEVERESESDESPPLLPARIAPARRPWRSRKRTVRRRFMPSTRRRKSRKPRRPPRRRLSPPRPAERPPAANARGESPA